MRESWMPALLVVVAVAAVLWGGHGRVGAAPEGVAVGDVRAALAKDGTSVRGKPSALSRAEGTLAHGAQVRVVEVRGHWIRVEALQGDDSGWLKANQTVEPFALTQGGQVGPVRTGAGARPSSDDVSAAGRQFDPETEQGYRKARPDLERFYPQVDAIEASAPDAEAVRRFVAEGRLGRPGGGE